MIGVALVSHTVLDRAAFMPSAKQITGQNHVTVIDQRPGLSRLVDDMSILNDFAASDIELTTCITYVGFLVAGFDEDIDEFVSYTRGMPHLGTTQIERRGVRAVVITGNLDQWRVATIEGCRAPEVSPVRVAFNEVYRKLTQLGLGRLFDGYKTVDRGSTFLLEKK